MLHKMRTPRGCPFVALFCLFTAAFLATTAWQPVLAEDEPTRADDQRTIEPPPPAVTEGSAPTEDTKGGSEEQEGGDPGKEKPTKPPAPVPTGGVEMPNFVVYGESGVDICLRAMFHAQMTVRFFTQGLVPTRQLVAIVDLPKTAEATGKCEKEKTTLSLQWDQYILSFVFEPATITNKNAGKEQTTAFWGATSMSFTFDAMNNSQFRDIAKPSAYEVKSKSGEVHFQTPYNMSYACASEEDITLNVYDANQTIDTTIVDSVGLAVWDTVIQPFKLNRTGQFSEAAACEKDVEKKFPRENVVPLAIAASLAGVILAIIIAYFFIKKRNQSYYKAMD